METSSLKTIAQFLSDPNLPEQPVSTYEEVYNSFLKTQFDTLKDYFGRFIDDITLITENRSTIYNSNEIYVFGSIDGTQEIFSIQIQFKNGINFEFSLEFPHATATGMRNNEITSDTRYYSKNKETFTKIFNHFTDEDNLKELNEFLKETEEFKEKILKKYKEIISKDKSYRYNLQHKISYSNK